MWGISLTYPEVNLLVSMFYRVTHVLLNKIMLTNRTNRTATSNFICSLFL